MIDPRRILVVDDDPDIRELTKTVLAGAGYDVATAAGGPEALDLLDPADPVDLVLLDINMPEVDGWETLRLIRVEEATRELPVVMFSVKGQVRDKLHALQEGATDYITKPFVIDELVRRVRRVLDDRGPAEG